MWFPWKSRCEHVFEESQKIPKNTYYRIIHFCHTTKINILGHDNTHNNRDKDKIMNNRRKSNNWNRHPPNWKNLNIDASIIDCNNCTGLALILRYFSGNMELARTLVQKIREAEQA